LQNLVEILSPISNVYVVAPDREKSASSHSMALNHPLRVNKINKFTASVDGTPTDCVKFGVLEFLKREKIDILVSGINLGENLGCDVLYSGTVAAAFEGCLFNIPSIAISVCIPANKKKFDFFSVSDFVKNIVGCVLKKGLPEDTILNINIPNTDKIKGVKFTKLGKRIYNDVMIKKMDPRGKPYYWIGGTEHGWKGNSDTDFYAIENNNISITPLHIDMTNYKLLKKIKNWECRI
jgi:5'-nucleotidase